MGQRHDRAGAFVHERLRLNQDNPPPADSAQGNAGLFLSFIKGKAVVCRQSLEAAKSNIVPVGGIFGAGVAQPCDEAIP